MIIKIIPPDETKEAITIHPRLHDEVIIGECFNGFSIPTDIGMYSICMRDGGIEVLLTPCGEQGSSIPPHRPNGEHQAKLVLSVDNILSALPWEVQQAHSIIYSTNYSTNVQCGHGGQ